MRLPTLAIGGVDTAENGPRQNSAKICRILNIYFENLVDLENPEKNAPTLAIGGLDTAESGGAAPRGARRRCGGDAWRPAA